jgi:hypothetical protein
MVQNDPPRPARTRPAWVNGGTVGAGGGRRGGALTAGLTLAVVAAALVAGCGRGSGPAGGAGPLPPVAPIGSTPAVPPASATTGDPAPSNPPRVRPPAPRSDPAGRPRSDPASTAAADLAPFFAAAEAADARIRAAAAAVNRGVGPTSTHFARSTRDLILASSPRQAGRAVPAGLTPALQRAVLLVYSELVARSAAFNMVDTTRTLPLSAGESVRLLDALRAGSVIARRYPADLAAARALAQASPPLRTVRPDSRPAAELALQIALINGENTGCGSAGGHLYPGPRPVRWETVVTDVGRFDGTIGGIMFAATYTVAGGWRVELNAC